MTDDTRVTHPDMGTAGADAPTTTSKPRTRGTKLQAALDKTVDVVSEKNERAGETLRAASDRIQATVDKVDPFVTERPYATLGLGVALGFFLGLLAAGRGPKVIYVKPPPPR